jgi:hypothetical protein
MKRARSSGEGPCRFWFSATRAYGSGSAPRIVTGGAVIEPFKSALSMLTSEAIGLVLEQEQAMWRGAQRGTEGVLYKRALVRYRDLTRFGAMDGPAHWHEPARCDIEAP